MDWKECLDFNSDILEGFNNDLKTKCHIFLCDSFNKREPMKLET